MAGEVIFSIVDKLAKLLVQEASLLGGVHEEVKWLEGELSQIQAFLQDADNQQAANENAKNLILRITEVSYDAEDVIDAFILKKAQRRRMTFIKRYAFVVNDLISSHKVKNEIKRIRTRIRSILDYRLPSDIQNTREGPSSSVSEALVEQRRSSPHSSDFCIFGFQNDVRVLQEYLINSNSELLFISIVGMGGCGKTTLAKAVYNSDEVKRHFDCRLWVHVSQNCNIAEILQDMEKQVRKFTMGKLQAEANPEGQNLFHFLAQRRYLIVMDDIWAPSVWERLKWKLPNVLQHESRVLVTTRRRDAVPRSYIHELELLNDQDSWELFLNRVFEVETQCPEHLEEVATLIVRKCGGLPLAIVVLAGLLSTKGTGIRTWTRVLDSLKWHLNQESGQCSAILALSYYDLPFYLKSCFLYFGLFPAGFQIPARRLIRLWMAEGFVQPRDQEAPEDVAMDYIQELVDRNIIQVLKKELLLSDGKGKKKVSITRVDQGESNWRSATCSVHDLVRNLALSMAKNVHFPCYGTTDHESLSWERVRRLAAHSGFSPSSPSLDRYSQRIRSVLLFNFQGNFSGKGITSKRFKFLRVLDLEDTFKPRLPNALGKLIHLRYLGLRRTWLHKLPSSVGNLFNLQTLDLKGTRINSVSASVWRLKQLRYLYLNWKCTSKVVPQPSEECPKDLQTLWGVFVVEKNFVRGRLDQFTNLKKLGIGGDLASQGEALTEWINQLFSLECLKLSSQAKECPPEISHSLATATHSNALPRLKSFHHHTHLTKLQLEGRLNSLFDLHEFPPNLTTLTLIGSLIRFDPMIRLEKLRNLRILRLWYNSYAGQSMVCASRGFAKLEVLEICELENIEEWMVEEGSMQNLQELQIYNCKRLRMLPNGLVHLTNIKELRLPAMPEALRARLLPYTGADWYKIQHIPFIIPPLIEEGQEYLGSSNLEGESNPSFLEQEQEHSEPLSPR